MRILPLILLTAVAAAPAAVEAKKLKPKYYKDCYADYNDMRKMVPEPPVDVEKTAKTVGSVASVAGRFGGFGGLGGLGGAAQTAVTVAKYSETIADIAAFTETMLDSYPMSTERFRAYGDRMKTEAGEMSQVADFATSSQSCYAQAYVDLKKGDEAGDIKKREVKKRHKEITIGVANVTEMLADAAQYMDTNISAYNQAWNQETSGAGFDLGKILSVANQAADVAGSVQGLQAAPGYSSRGYTGSVHAEAHRQSMKLQYEAAGIPNPHPAPALPSEGYFGGMSSLSTLAAFGSIDPGMGAAAAMQMGVAEANLKSAGYEKPAVPEAMQASQPAPEDEIKALIEAGADVKPYLDSYNEIKGLSEVQQSVAAFVNTPI